MSRRSRIPALTLWCCCLAALGASAPAAALVRVGLAPKPPVRSRALGAVAGATPLRVDVTLEPRDPGAAYAAAVATPGSAVYRDYLTVAQFMRRFGPTQAQIGAVETSLRLEGLRPGAVAADGLSIPVSASASELTRALSVSLERYALPSGRVAFANTRAPLFAAGAAAFVQGVVGLDTLTPPAPVGLRRASARAGARVTIPHIATGGPQPCATATMVAASEPTTYTADQIASAYRFSSLYAAGNEGAGQTIAVYELEGSFPSDITAFQSCYGTSASVTYQEVDGGPPAADPNNSDGLETELDVEQVVSLAPKAKVIVYQGPDSG